MRALRKVVANKFKNEEKRKSRLRKRARMLTDFDLVALVMKMRSDEKPDPSL